MKVDCEHGNEMDTITLMGTSVNDKAEWMADIAQVRKGEWLRLAFIVRVFPRYSASRMRSKIRSFNLKGELLAIACLPT